jgi:hypothetical protein
MRRVCLTHTILYCPYYRDAGERNPAADAALKLQAAAGSPVTGALLGRRMMRLLLSRLLRWGRKRRSRSHEGGRLSLSVQAFAESEC